MMTIKQCHEQLSAQYPKLHFDTCVKYNEAVFIFVDTKTDAFDPYIAIDRNTGNTMPFVPTFDLEGFAKAFKERRVKL